MATSLMLWPASIGFVCRSASSTRPHCWRCALYVARRLNNCRSNWCTSPAFNLVTGRGLLLRHSWWCHAIGFPLSAVIHCHWTHSKESATYRCHLFVISCWIQALTRNTSFPFLLSCQRSICIFISVLWSSERLWLATQKNVNCTIPYKQHKFVVGQIQLNVHQRSNKKLIWTEKRICMNRQKITNSEQVSLQLPLESFCGLNIMQVMTR